MRYGVVRSSPELPPPSVQRRLIEAVGCDIVLEEGASNSSNHRSLLVLLFGLRRGDEVIVHELDCLDATTGELARLIRRFFEVGVTLKIVGGSQMETLAPSGVIPRALALLADHETRRPHRAATRQRTRTPEARLTQHQLGFARDMHRRGHSMRAIGLLFRLTPNEVAKLLRTARSDITDAESDDRTPSFGPPPIG
ncbi:MAG: recombinase family protein [Alphaproteobacteria bacterium]|nr:recombinase family protein [Alphaproteobacteria bacterium]MBU1516826.1 recombinase family protein [Alphaproteobacteria bacterium]MBU2092520.1 recombinase family protein [Alphaproteobacteria bacterium]MBU2151368.1 recombinase family protein [Alphaproteobacteria bacterium]MBU2309671.1 recombinase family protein [Alphaproteobacteria bacterium]